MERLLQLPKVNTSEELKKLRLVFDKTELVIRSLQGIGVTPKMYGTFLTPILMSKIPNDLCLILNRKINGILKPYETFQRRIKIEGKVCNDFCWRKYQS